MTEFAELIEYDESEDWFQYCGEVFYGEHTEPVEIDAYDLTEDIYF